jgi:hypothetical protein
LLCPLVARACAVQIGVLTYVLVIIVGMQLLLWQYHLGA